MLFSNRLIPILALFLCLTLLPATAIAADTPIESSKSVNNVTIDGKWTSPNEWKDAVEYDNVRGKRNFGYILIKDDGQYIYALLDYIADETVDDGDLGRVRFDLSEEEKLTPREERAKALGDCGCTGDIPGSSPEPHDFIFSVEWNGGKNDLKIWQGNGSEWVLTEKKPSGFLSASSNDVMNDPYSNESHMIYEFAVPRAIWGDVQELGFSAFGLDKGERNLNRAYMALPDQGSYLKPFVWASLPLATPYEKDTATTTSPAPTKTTASPTPTPKTTTTPSPTITTPSPTITQTPEKPSDETMFSQIPGGYLTIGGIIALIVIALVGILVYKRK